MHEAISQASIEKANGLFWEQMLAMQLNPVEQNSPETTDVRCIGVEHVVGSCDLAGVWSGRIEVRLSTSLALEATAAMLMLPVDQVQVTDVLDATKEIANMIAGTLKSALPRPCTMTVPSAALETVDFCILPRTCDSVAVFFCHRAGELMVRVWEQAAESKSEIDDCVSVCA